MTRDVRSRQVTFCIPSFNRADLVAETLDSLLAQTDPRWEAVIVDDGSTDHSAAVIDSYAARDARIRPIARTRGPKGACTCRNVAVDNARGDYLVFLDTDDIVAPFCVAQRLTAATENPDADFIIFPALLFHDVPGDLDLWWNVQTAEDELTRQFHQDAVCQGTGPLFRRDAMLSVGGWNERLALWQDIELFFRFYIQRYRYVTRFDLPPDLHIRRSPASLSRGDFFAREKFVSRAEVVRLAARLLRDNGQADRLPQLRFMTAEIITGVARARHFDLARDLVAWAGREAIFAPEELQGLRRYVRLHRTRLVRISPLKRYASRVADAFQAPSSLGRLAHSTTPARVTPEWAMAPSAHV